MEPHSGQPRPVLVAPTSAGGAFVGVRCSEMAGSSLAVARDLDFELARRVIEFVARFEPFFGEVRLAVPAVRPSCAAAGAGLGAARSCCASGKKRSSSQRKM